MLTPAELVSLLAAVANGDQTAFEKLYAATSAKLLRRRAAYLAQARACGRGHAGNLSEDLEQRGQFDPSRASPITWMVAIARNRAIDLVRKKADVSVEELPEALELAADTADPLTMRERSEDLGRLLECLGRLDPEQRQLVLLAYYNG